jgi:hypothetical protein
MTYSWRAAIMSRSSASPPAAPAQLRLYLFGQFRLESQSRLIRLPTRKVESLLAYLALFPHATFPRKTRRAALGRFH